MNSRPFLTSILFRKFWSPMESPTLRTCTCAWPTPPAMKAVYASLIDSKLLYESLVYVENSFWTIEVCDNLSLWYATLYCFLDIHWDNSKFLRTTRSDELFFDIVIFRKTKNWYILYLTRSLNKAGLSDWDEKNKGFLFVILHREILMIDLGLSNFYLFIYFFLTTSW